MNYQAVVGDRLAPPVGEIGLGPVEDVVGPRAYVLCIL